MPVLVDDKAVAAGKGMYIKTEQYVFREHGTAAHSVFRNEIIKWQLYISPVYFSWFLHIPKPTDHQSTSIYRSLRSSRNSPSGKFWFLPQVFSANGWVLKFHVLWTDGDSIYHFSNIETYKATGGANCDPNKRQPFRMFGFLGMLGTINPLRKVTSPFISVHKQTELLERLYVFFKNVFRIADSLAFSYTREEVSVEIILWNQPVALW